MGLRDMYAAILMLILVGVLLGVGIYTLIGIRTGIQEEMDGFEPDLNITLGEVAGGVTYLNASLAGLYVDPSKVSVVWSNGTDETLTNYTIGPGGDMAWGGDIQDDTTGNNGDGTVNITYKYKYDQQNPSAAVTTAVAGIDDFADWIAIIVVVLAAAIILGVVMKSFGGASPGV